MDDSEKKAISNIVNVLEGVARKVRHPVEGKPEIGAAADIEAQVEKLKRLAGLR